MNYGDLKKAIAGYLHRDDMSDQIVTAIQLAAARIGRDLRHRCNYVSTITTIQPIGIGGLPDRMREVQTVSAQAGTFDKTLQVVGIQQWAQVQANGTGSPRVYCAEDGIVRVAPVSALTDVQISGWFQPAPLVNDTDSNSVLDYAPQLYVYGALMESFYWSQDGDLTSYAKQQYQNEIDLLNAETRSQNTGINPTMRRVR